MEVPFDFEREEDEMVDGVDLQTTKRKSQHSKNPQSPTTSDSSITSESSENNFEYFSAMNGNSINNGEEPKFNLEGRSGIKEVDTPKIESLAAVAEIEEKKGFEEPNSNKQETAIDVAENGKDISFSTNEGTNGFSVEQNGDSTAHFLPQSNEGDQQIDVGSNGPSLSRSPDTAVGLKYVESLLDETSNSSCSSPPDISNGEHDLLANNIVIRGQNASIDIGFSEQPISEEAEFDVEKVLEKQESHDLYCPNCDSCITKRVILRRRKRKIEEIATGEEAVSSKPGLTAPPAVPGRGGDIAPGEHHDDIVEETSENEPPQVGEAPDATVDAVTCLSCLSIFIPTSNGFLFWKFERKPETALQPDGLLTKPTQNTAPPAEEPSLPREETDRGETLADAPIHDGKGVTSAKPLQAIAPSEGSSLPTELETDMQGTLADIPVDNATGKVFPTWILTCCQPFRVEKKPEYTEKPDETIRDLDSRPPSTLEDGTKVPVQEIKPSVGTTYDRPAPPKAEPPTVPVHESEPPFATTDDTPVPPKAEPAITPFDDTPLAPKPVLPDGDEPLAPKPVLPDRDIQLPPKAESSAKPESGNEVVVPMPEEPDEPQPPEIRPPDIPPEAGPLPDIEAPLLESPCERPRTGVSGLDIIKAIVYGGLLESITSLSIISSAAGGDATTLNIVALGLANVFGGLIVLGHNLKVLKHEHTTEHYEDQLGRPGHFLLHATIAVISYLIFGLMPPIVYAFSFRKTDDKDMKLATLASASLVCIMVLSIGKAYVRRPPKAYLQTIFYYLSLGLMVSGIGYVAGDQINVLLKKLGVFDSRSSITLGVTEAGAVRGAWSSY